MDFRCLGPLEVRVDGLPVDLGEPQRRLVLGVLLASVNTVVSTDRLVDSVWGPDPPGSGRKIVQGYVSGLRKTLGDRDGEVIESASPGYRLAVKPGQVDSLRFEQVAAEGLAEVAVDPHGAGVLLAEALSLWRGDPYEDLADHEALRSEIARLEQLRVSTLEGRVGADVLSGREGGAVAELGELTSRFPLRERLWSLRMLALYRSGRQTEALRVFDEARRILAAEVGLEPSGELRRVEQRILDQDPVLDTLGALEPDAALAVTSARNPYKGLRAFEEADAADFHGRDALVRRLRETVERRGESRLVVLAGPSGSGKSSVVGAGLIPALRHDGWSIATMYPGAAPSQSLTAAVESLDDGRRSVLVVDQLEEVITLATEAARRDFLDSLAGLATDVDGPVVIVTVRTDFLDELLVHGRFARLVEPGLLLVTPLEDHEVRDVIVAPASRAGVAVEPDLVAAMVRDVAHRAQALPLLEYALTDLYDRTAGGPLTLEALEAADGISGALVKRAEEVHAGLGETGQATTRQLFLRLVALTDDREAVRRRVSTESLSGLAEIEAVLSILGQHRLITFDSDPLTNSPTVEVAHEALLARWPRLAEWITEAQEDLVLQQRLNDAVAEWSQHDHDDAYLLAGGRLAQFQTWATTTALTPTTDEADYLERSTKRADQQRADRRRRRNLVTTGFAIAAVIATALGIAALISRQDAANNAELAQQRAAEAEVATLISRSGELSVDEPVVSILLALEANRRAPGPDTERAVLNALSRSSLGTRVATFEPFPAVTLPGRTPFLNSDGLSRSVVEEGRLYRQSLVTGEIVDLGPVPDPEVARWGGDEVTGRRFAQSLDHTRMWFGPYDGAWEVELESEEPLLLMSPLTWTANRLVFATRTNTYLGDGLWETTGLEPPSDLVILDASTGDPVGPGVEGITPFGAVVSSDAELIAVGADMLNELESVATEVEGTVEEPVPGVVVLEAETGEEVFHVEVPGLVTGLAFDTNAGELLVATSEARLVTVDLSAQAVVEDVDTSARETRTGPGLQSFDIVGFGLRRDGRAVVVTPGMAEMVDRRDGPVPGTGIELRDALFGFMRADDTLLVVNSDPRFDVYDFEGVALAEQAIDLPEGSSVALGTGAEAVLDRRGDGTAFELIDLATESRSPLFEAEEESFLVERIEPNNVWTFGLETNTLSRWSVGQRVEEIQVAGPDASLGGGGLVRNRHAYVTRRPDGSQQISLVNTEPGELQVLLTIDAIDDTCGVYPAPAGGLYAMSCLGPLRAYDSSGLQTDEIETGLLNLMLVAGDEVSGRLAYGGWLGNPSIRTGAAIVDPASRELQVLPDIDLVASLTFARDGALLAVLSLDGTLRLWDAEEGRDLGVLWNGTGASPGDALWYDETTDSLWVSSDDRLLRLPLDPQRWLERACELVGRDFTQEEWDRFVPGDEPLQSACA